LAVRVQAAAQDHVRIFVYGGFTQRREELRLARSIGIEEPQQLRVGLPPGLFDRGAVALYFAEKR